MHSLRDLQEYSDVQQGEVTCCMMSSGFPRRYLYTGIGTVHSERVNACVRWYGDDKSNHTTSPTPCVYDSRCPGRRSMSSENQEQDRSKSRAWRHAHIYTPHMGGQTQAFSCHMGMSLTGALPGCGLQHAPAFRTGDRQTGNHIIVEEK